MKKLIKRSVVMTLTVFLSGCTSVLFFLANAPTAFSSLKRSANLAYGTDVRQRLDVYAPQAGQNRPVVIFWYSGAWTEGRKENYRFVGEALAAHGFVTVIPDYRLYPAVKFPLFIDDAAQAVAWVQQHAHEFGADPQRIVLMGHSAGAHMAAMLAFSRAALEKSGAKPQWIRGLVGLSGPYALEPNSKILNTIFAEPYTQAQWQPIRFVDERCPPVLLMHGLSDDRVTSEHTVRLRDALKSAGVPVEAHLYPKRNHADTVAGFAWGTRGRIPALENTVRFIERVTG